MNRRGKTAALVGIGLLGLAGVHPDEIRAQTPVSRAEIDMNVWRSAPEATGVVDIQRLAGPVELDGMSDEAASRAEVARGT